MEGGKLGRIRGRGKKEEVITSYILIENAYRKRKCSHNVLFSIEKA